MSLIRANATRISDTFWTLSTIHSSMKLVLRVLRDAEDEAAY